MPFVWIKGPVILKQVNCMENIVKILLDKRVCDVKSHCIKDNWQISDFLKRVYVLNGFNN